MKENKAFRIPFIAKKQLKSSQALHRIFLKPNTTHTAVPQSSLSTHPFLMLPLFQKHLIPRLESTNGKQCCLPPLSFKINLKANINISP